MNEAPIPKALDQARLAEAEATSAALHARRAALYRAGFEARDTALAMTRASLAWRLTEPVRVAIDLAAGRPVPQDAALRDLVRFWRLARAEGVSTAWRRARRKLRPPAPPPAARARAAEFAAIRAQRQSRPPAETLSPLVLIIAELSVPQCAKYRVWQKQEMISALGLRCEVVDWRRAEAAAERAQCATLAIFYRVPLFAEAKLVLAECARLRLPTRWEVDDLIFDDAAYRGNRNLDRIDPRLRRSVLEGVTHYRAAMLACDGAIASTSGLAAAMRRAGVEDVQVIENALDTQTLAIAAAIRAEPGPPHGGVRIGYGSGTRTHDADFAQATPALLRLLAARPDTSLRVMGELELDPGFAAFAGRIERLPQADYATYLRHLGACDISIAPLEPTLFNDAKSSIKHLEAAVLGLPSVCSPRAAFRDAMTDGTDGFFADDDAAWFAALDRLAADASLRRRVGEAARQTAIARYAPDAMARRAVAPMLASLDRRQPVALRVLIANIYFAPRSFGGATLVAEEMARRLAARADVAVTIVCAAPPPHGGVLRRWESEGLTVFGLPAAELGDPVLDFDDPVQAELFTEVLRAARPDIVHLHSLQGLGAGLARACRREGIAYVVTVHDAWWLCARQFMVTGEGRYCFQREIDLRTCQTCIPAMAQLWERRTILHEALHAADLVLSPSESHRQLHIENGFAAERLIVAPNGVRLPSRPRPQRPAGAPLRLAYVGGNVAVKGHDLLRAALAALPRRDYTLTIVDNTLNLGFSSIDRSAWRIGGELRIVAAYTPDTMDAFFDEIDVLLFPSQWKESFGLTVREALARHVWVVATDGGGPAEAVVDGVNGTLLPLDGDPAPWTAAVAALLDDAARFNTWRNPHAAGIGDFASQEAALYATLRDVVATRSALARAAA